jgi:hypothetical protein
MQKYHFEQYGKGMKKELTLLVELTAAKYFFDLWN